MDIFIPSIRDPNPFFDEIEDYSKHQYKFDHYSNYKPTFPVVNIHWPEALLNWKEPTESDLKEITEAVKRWKKNSVLVYTRHDSKPHKSKNGAFQILFEIIEEHADAFIHLGEFSKNQLERIYPSAKHIVIPHPLYTNSYQAIDKKEARETLGINNNDFVVMAPGRIRKLEERNLVIQSFKDFPLKNKVLLCNQMVPFGFPYEFKGSTTLKKLVNLDNFTHYYFTSRHKPPSFRFHYGFSSRVYLSLMLSASDVVVIPRIDTLNSGVLFLALSFQKMIVGPGIGNIKEHLEFFKFPVFNPDSKESLTKALYVSYNRIRKEEFFNPELMKEFHPQLISSTIDRFFENLTIS